jgi:thiol:disulfide interchange protein DsbA
MTMTMKRREFSIGLLGAGLAAGSLPGTGAHAQGGVPVEGTHYVRLAQPVPVAVPGKIEVIEFFWYGCPHCNAFEPMLDAWQKKLPADVAFRRVPVAFRDEPYVAHQRIFYALDEMKQVESMHRKVFYAIHNDHQRMDKPADIAAFMTKNGIDGNKFLEHYNGFSMQARLAQAAQLAKAYRIDGVPSIGVQGRYFTSPSMAGSPDRSLAVADWLIQQSRGKT